MIRLAENMNDLRSLCGNSPFGCQILSAANAYGLDKPFAQFWTDVGAADHGCACTPCVEETTAQGCALNAPLGAAYGKLDGVMRICGTMHDAEEAKAFLRAIGAESVVCSEENAEKLGLNVTERGVILRKDLPAVYTPEPSTEEVPLRELYNVLAACNMVGEFEPFYLDLSHRVRHHAAMCCFEVAESFGHSRSLRGERKDTGQTRMETAPEICAAAIAVFGGDCSLISAVAVRPEYQRRGFGRQVMQQMEAKLSGRVYLLRAENENERFYASLGYEPCGAWCSGTLG